MPSYKIKKGCVVNIKTSDKSSSVYEVQSLSGDKGESVEMTPQDALAHLDVLDVTPEEIAKDVKKSSKETKKKEKE